MSTAPFDIVIIGGGIIGLASALEATRRFPSQRILVLEKENRVAAHQTGHNSGVIHSGIYYQPGSLKARTCVEGAAAMVAFCREHSLPHELCGKVVVATREEELPALEELQRRGTANGVPDLTMIGTERLREIEPHSAGIRALHVPVTGITDYVAVAEKYAQLVAERGGEVRTGTRVLNLARRGGEMIVETTKGPFSARSVINCAGLHSDRIARLAGARTDSIIVPFRGEYYEITPERHDPGRHELVRGLIYPVPDPKFPFLGVHFTRRIRGGVEAGPNAVLALRREGYRKTDFSFTDALTTFTYPGFWRMAGKYWRSGLDEFYRSLSKRAFVHALQRLVPEIQETDLRPGGSGVRAQALDRNGKLLDDFHIVRADGVIHVLNVPSPAATASLVIGRTIVDLLA
ncbi:MAG: hydroxyglutarate oxidase [Acidobacteria bacterium RIFCSPLOWO2_02_FULL_61_28]|nr:MAG: hydroxyglutarate oxidase [Acidobacteria bacterium RIFCSPLOWO2_02_FULL_61_28]